MQDVTLEQMLSFLHHVQDEKVRAKVEEAATKRKQQIAKQLDKFKGTVFRFRRVLPIEPDYVMVWSDGTIDVANEFVEHYIRYGLSTIAKEEERIHTFLDDE
jgi:hypothetical protein